MLECSLRDFYFDNAIGSVCARDRSRGSAINYITQPFSIATAK